MRLFNGLIGATFLTLALLHLVTTPLAHFACTAMLAAGAFLALTTLMSRPSRIFSRSLALATTVLMFAFFATFFRMVPGFEPKWYMGAEGIEAVSLLVAAFALIPVLSSHSCRLKADCTEQQAQQRAGFFSVPKSLQKTLSN